MIIAKFTSNNAQMGETRTYENFYKFLGAKPERLGVVSRLYEDLTASYLTEALSNIYTQSNKPAKFQSINSMMFEWETETNYIKRIEFAAVPTGDGANGSEITMAFKERYYEKYDIFKIDKSFQQCIVVSRPIRRADNYWEVNVRLIDNDYKSTLDATACQIGDTTRFQSVAMPELHEEGYIKYQSNIARHRNFITTFRCDDSYSALYAAHEETFINIAEGKDQGSLQETIYKMEKKEKVLLDNFLYARNNGLLFNKCNVNPVTGKPTLQDPDTGRPIWIGDGIIPQVERFASKYGFNKLTINVFTTMLSMLNEKAEKPQGNHYMFICNEKMFNLVQNTLFTFLAAFKVTDTLLWSKAANSYVKVGTTFDTYEYGGNTISFKVDRTFSREYGREKGYALCLDLTADTSSAEPPIQMFTLKGGQLIQNQIYGVGGKDGLSSGVVSTPVSGSKLVLFGYAGVGVFNPYRSFILREL